MSVRPEDVPDVAEEQDDGTWVALDIVDEDGAIRRESWAADGTPLFFEYLDADTRARRRICLFLPAGRAELDFLELIGIVTRTDATCRSMGPTLPEFPDRAEIVRITFQLVNPEPAFLRYEIGLVAFQNAAGHFVDADGARIEEPEWLRDEDLFADTQETDIVVEELPGVGDSEPSSGSFEGVSLDDTQETDAEFEAEAWDDDDTENSQLPELDIEPLLVNEPSVPAEDELLELNVEPLVPNEPQMPDSDALPQLEVEPLIPLDESHDDFMLPPDEDDFMLAPDEDPSEPTGGAAAGEAIPASRVHRYDLVDIPLSQVTNSDRDGRFISTYADDKLHVEAIYEGGALTSFSKLNFNERPEFRRTTTEGRDMLVIYGDEGTLSYIRTPTTRRVQVQHDGLVKWDQLAEFNPDMTAEEFKSCFKVYNKLHRHFAYHQQTTPWRLEVFGFEPYSAMVDEFDEFFDATIFAENRAGDWLVMIDEPGPHQGKVFINFHQDGLYHLDVLDGFIADYVDPEIVDDRNLLIEDMPFFSDDPILGGYARVFAEINLLPADDLLAGLRNVPVLDLADLM